MSQAQLIPTDSPSSPTIIMHEGHPATTSREVAKYFGKRHDDVLKSIRNLIANCPEEFTARNFAASEYMDETGRTLVMFIIYRDGFMLLVMGYTGKKAMQIKIAYIEAFNAMEAQLAAQQKEPMALPPSSLTPSTVSDREPLRAIVNAWSRISGQPQNNLWPQVRAAFNITNIKQLPAEWVPDAIAWVQAKIDALPPAPEQKALPAVPSPSASFLSAADIAALEAAGQRVIALSAYVHREIHELHVEILNVLDIRRMPGSRWRAMSSHIWYSLLEAVSVGPESLTRDTVTGREDRNPAYWTLEMLKDMPAA